MNVPLGANSRHETSFEPSDMFFGGISEFDDLVLLNDFEDQCMSNSYEHALKRAADSLVEDSMDDDVDTSPRDQPATSLSTDSERSADASTKLRRRAQNRASQRAFRERKERHMRNLKATLESLGDKHRKLLDSYSQQSEAVMKLKGRIAELHAQIAATSMQSGREQASFHCPSQNSCAPDFHRFDAFSFSSKPPSNHNTIFWHDQSLLATGVGTLNLPASQNLPEFEDLLNSP